MRASGIVVACFASALLSGCGKSPLDNPGQRADALIAPTARVGEQGDKKDRPQGRVADRPKKLETIDALEVDALTKNEGKWVRVKGKIHSTHMAQSGKAFTLNVGPNWKTCFKAVVFQGDFDKWKNEADGIKAGYEGKLVVIEGKIKIYKGSPEIVVSTPSQIEVVTEADK